MNTIKLPADIAPDWLTGITDTREKTPLVLSPLRSVTATLDIGDYSLVGAESIVRVERKSESDFLGCCGGERKRFERELERLRGFEHRALVIESTWQRIERAEWRSQITANQALGSLLGWAAMNIPIFMVGDHARAGKFVSRFLYICARRRWRDLRKLTAGMEAAEA